MIAHIRGTVLALSEKTAVIDVSGVGYRVFATSDTLKTMSIGGETSLFTYLSVRENALDLFGFFNERELNFFELLITISGIGPKSAIGILGLAPISSLQKAISNSDIGYLTKVSGIGKKTAEKIILELKDKVTTDGNDETDTSGTPENKDAFLALVALGYNERDVRDALKEIPKEELSTSETVRRALQNLGK